MGLQRDLRLRPAKDALRFYARSKLLNGLNVSTIAEVSLSLSIFLFLFLSLCLSLSLSIYLFYPGGTGSLEEAASVLHTGRLYCLWVAYVG